MQKDKIIGVLIGLVGACDSNPKTENTDRLILKALSLTDGNDETVLIRQIREEKYRIAPGCATCATPCGNTSDYDMDKIYRSETAICNLKQQIITEICQLATSFLQYDVVLTEENMGLFYKALAYIGYDLDEQTLLALLDEIHKTEQR